MEYKPAVVSAINRRTIFFILHLIKRMVGLNVYANFSDTIFMRTMMKI